jgi:hypothetical protein
MRAVFLGLICTVLLAASTSAAVPSSMVVQGRLTDASGNPLPAGNKSFTFRIFNDTAAGAQVWPAGGVGEVQMISSDAAGLWIGRIGISSPLDDNDFDNPARWLQVTVDGTTLPRIRLVSVPYALRTGSVDGATGGSITSKVSIGPGHTNSGNDAFVAGNSNTVSGWYSAVGGGSGNVASEFYATVSGGNNNVASNFGVAIGGGLDNYANGYAASIGGGLWDTASGYAAHIGGGMQNSASGYTASVGGGHLNDAPGSYSTVGGGKLNLASGPYSVVAGGGSTSVNSRNTASGSFSTVGGGEYNIADSSYCTVAGGTANWIYGSGGTISGGHFNSIASTSRDAAIGGGESNSADGSFATIPGGRQNEADGNYAFAAGRRAHAQHGGAFVWADTTNADFISTGPNQFLIRAAGGVGIGTNAPDAALHIMDGNAAGISGNGNASAVFERDGENWIHMLTPDAQQCGILFGIAGNSLMGSIRFNAGNNRGYDFRAGSNDSRLILDSLGNLTADGYICGSVIGCPSDARFKQDIEPVDHALEIVGQLRGVRYNWRRAEFPEREFPKGQQVGLLAQEVREVVPQAVIEQPDGYLAVDYARLVPLLIEGMKEQQRQIDELRQTIQSMRP